MTKPYRTLFVGTLVQTTFLSAGGSDDPDTTVDSPFCRDGHGRPTLRGTGLSGALIATLRRLNNGVVPDSISGSKNGRQPSVWRFFNSHPHMDCTPAYRQHVEIDARTGAAASSMLFNIETLPPDTRWPFMLEVDMTNDSKPAELARKALAHWAAGRCLIGREVARGLGWMRLEDLREYRLTTEELGDWPCAVKADDYPAYIADRFKDLATAVPMAEEPLPGWLEITGSISVGERADDYGIDSLSIGGHASEELAAAWDERFLAPDGMMDPAASFDPDFAIVSFERKDDEDKATRLPYIPGSSLRGPLRHALARLLKSRGKKTQLVDTLFGTVTRSAKLLISDALPDQGEGAPPIQLAWLQQHAEDEFAGGAYESAKFDRVALMQGRFPLKMVLEDATKEEIAALGELFALARISQVGIGGGQWRGHGWLHWQVDNGNLKEHVQ